MRLVYQLCLHIDGSTIMNNDGIAIDSIIKKGKKNTQGKGRSWEVM